MSDRQDLSRYPLEQDVLRTSPWQGSPVSGERDAEVAAPFSPRRFSAGTVQSSNTTSLGTAAVRIVLIGRALKPGVPFSMTKQEIPSNSL